MPAMHAALEQQSDERVATVSHLCQSILWSAPPFTLWSAPTLHPVVCPHPSPCGLPPTPHPVVCPHPSPCGLPPPFTLWSAPTLHPAVCPPLLTLWSAPIPHPVVCPHPVASPSLAAQQSKQLPLHPRGSLWQSGVQCFFLWPPVILQPPPAYPGRGQTE